MEHKDQKEDADEEEIENQKLIKKKSIITEKNIKNKVPNNEQSLFLQKIGLILKSFQSKFSISTNSINNQLYEGEEVKFSEQCFFVKNKISYFEGIMYITDFRALFILNNPETYEKEIINKDYMNLLFTFIVRTKKKKDKNSNNNYLLIKIVLKDRPALYFAFTNKKTHENVMNTLNDSINIKSINSFFAFKHFQRIDKMTGNNEKSKSEKIRKLEINGWNVYEYYFEFQRMGLLLESKECLFRLYIQDMQGLICETYPNFVITLKNITNEELKNCANFRTKKRFPALTWANKVLKGTLWRSSQSKPGVTQKRSTEDEKFLKMLQENTHKLHIYDARPYLNALAQTMKGNGFEKTSNYVNSELFFCDIENIHYVRDSFEKMQKLCSTMDQSTYFHDIQNSGWLDTIAKIMKSSVDIVSSLYDNATVLVHCSDGWDRTSQLVSLAQIMIDPYYRTIKGFAVLIEKDWTSFGHQFALRCGHALKKDLKAQCPVFLQWLDCVHQLIFQFPKMFEFKIDLLVFLAYHVYSGIYGNFLVDNEKIKSESYIKLKTISIWGDVLINRDIFLNIDYSEEKSIKTILTPCVSFHKLRLWEEYFLRWKDIFITHNEVFAQYKL